MNKDVGFVCYFISNPGAKSLTLRVSVSLVILLKNWVTSCIDRNASKDHKTKVVSCAQSLGKTTDRRNNGLEKD